MRTRSQSLFPWHIQMLNLNPSHWLTSLKRSQPIWRSREETHELLTDSDPSDHTTTKWTQAPKYGISRTSLRNVHIRTLCGILLLGLVASIILLYRQKAEPLVAEYPRRPWESFRRLDGYYQGISKLVKFEQFIPENGNATYGRDGRRSSTKVSRFVHADLLGSTSEYSLNFELLRYQPQLRSTPPTDNANVQPVQQCYLKIDNEIPAPSIYAFEGVPQHGAEPLFGSYDALGLRKDACFDRYGRYGPYGLGYASDTGGSDLGLHGDQSLIDPVWKTSGRIDWRSIDLGDAQRRCYQLNQGRFAQVEQSNHHEHVGSLAEFPDEDWQRSHVHDGNRSTILRTVVVLRAWGGLEYTPAVRLYIRSLVNELSLHSGGEYDVHLLVEVKDIHKTIWTSKVAYDEVLAEIVPEEFRSMATLWSQELMKLIYPGPFQPQFAFHGSMYPAMRSMHFALQWFMVQHPEYEYFWNWETDIRYIGHWYELFYSVSTWAKKQPRDHLWARSARFYIPALYNDWDAFVRDTEQKSPEKIDNSRLGFDQKPGSTEEADLITFNPIFDPAHTLWNRRLDVTGYDTSLPIPERRASIVISARFSRRLLLIMHNETYIQRHSMASEMFPPSMCLHHGLKAVFAPHPVYLETDWPAEYAEKVFNGGPAAQTGLYEDSVFGEGPKGNEHALKGTTYYYDSQFAGVLWRRWMGYKEKNGGGAKDELRQGENGMGGRMCLRSTLLHPIKWDVGRID
ncbi:hypothetical protein H2198_000134 [Neophaeococcomyces mojaviensis]|uniref:Uncharacterized protein n=1 Tax=Neophaeococcomyces mojaviensis TaxID=3383035 RepID=A0ACC3ALR1_9EURO|nr:hypothetical protein H2198_000134 [Knufia sp. JES_112]